MNVSTSKFLAPLDARKIGPQRWMLLDNFPYQSAYLNGVVVAPRGFQTDFASIPRVFWTIFPKTDVYDAAAVIHDAAYGHALQTEDGARIEAVKSVADRLFYEALKACGCGDIRAQFMYQAVSHFGDPAKHPLAQNKP